MKKYLGFIILSVFILGIGLANAETRITLEKVFTQITPLFMKGHQGDMASIEGFEFSGDILLNGSKIGDFNGTASLLNPPLMASERYDQGITKFENTIYGMGQFDVCAQITTLGNINGIDPGQAIFGWHGSIANGSNTLKGLAGISTGSGSFSLFNLNGTGQETLIYTFETTE